MNHDNWAEEEEPEESGVFQKADDTELANRKIKVAKRRLAGADGTTQPRANIFSGFTGFGAAASTASATKPMFNFGSFNAQTSATALPTSAKTFAFSAVDGKEPTSKPPTSDAEKSANFGEKLVQLNKAVLDCIKQHIDSGKVCILSPIFDDYKKHVKELEDNDSRKPATFSFSDKTNNNETLQKPVEVASAGSSFKFSEAITTNAAKPAATTSTVPTFSFGASSTPFGSAAAPAPGFFGFTKPPEQTAGGSEEKKDENGGNKDDDEDQPPKVEFTPVVENDSLYSKRCKVFVKSGDEFKSRGTGMLYIKEVSGKKQLLVRADTSLGNILLNILFAGTPFKRMGKNNLCTVCIPTPEAEQKPVQVLIRVKNEDEADELLAEIKKHQAVV